MRFITPSNKILLASQNPAKRERLAWLLEGLGYDLLDMLQESSARGRSNGF